MDATQNMDAILDNLVLPSLQKLLMRSVTTGLTSMIARSAPPLTDLTIMNTVLGGEEISLLQKMPSVRDLCLLDTCIAWWFFRRVGSTAKFSASLSDGRVEPFLPTLSSLKIRCEQAYPWSSFADLFGLDPDPDVQSGDDKTQVCQPLRRLFVEMEHAGPTVLRYYEMEDHEVDPIDEVTLWRLRTLQAAGISIEIYDHRGTLLFGANDEDEDMSFSSDEFNVYGLPFCKLTPSNPVRVKDRHKA
ncbi:unnamed protein product [Cyclocybe aegerita]|uniref:Uncharacterized protein n=1 Tax=Cyclocybe aegerita TaxID=1973307 RepID=A0A8S0VUT6_CYCAE|nr:unnamed protein product [Cyclocybe aegerita]